MRLELVGLDGASAYVSAEEVGRTVGSLRRWASARAGLPSPSLLRLKSGCRDLCSDEAPLSEVDARVQALLRLPGGTHNKYFFSGRLEGVRKTPEAGNEPQQFNPPGSEEGPLEKDVFPVSTAADSHGAASYNIGAMLLEAIRMSDLLWDIARHRTFEAVIDQIYYECTYATPWVPGTHKKGPNAGMQSAVRGVSNAGQPSAAFTFLLKLFILRLTRQQIKQMLEHTDSPYIRAVGFLYLRVGMGDGFKELWSWFEPYLGDPEPFEVDGSPATKTTIGEWLRRLLTDLDYFGDRLPRIPVMVQRTIDAKLKEWDAAGGAAAHPPPHGVKPPAAEGAGAAAAVPPPPPADGAPDGAGWGGEGGGGEGGGGYGLGSLGGGRGGGHDERADRDREGGGRERDNGRRERERDRPEERDRRERERGERDERDDRGDRRERDRRERDRPDERERGRRDERDRRDSDRRSRSRERRRDSDTPKERERPVSLKAKKAEVVRLERKVTELVARIAEQERGGNGGDARDE